VTGQVSPNQLTPGSSHPSVGQVTIATHFKQITAVLEEFTVQACSDLKGQ